MDNFGFAKELVSVFREKRCTLSFAESCTGGLCSATVVSVAGASDIFYGGVVSYDNSVKKSLLFVPESVLSTVGAVSEECAIAMANGARKQCGTDIAVSVTGIAGPGGGTKEKPVGLVYVGVASARGAYAKKLLLCDAGDRTAIRERSVFEVLSAALDEINMI